MTTRDRLICEKLISEISVASELIQGITLDGFMEDERTARAVAMTLINIGELVKNLTPGLKEAHPEIPWRAISGMRDITAHKYQTLRREDVFNTCTSDLPVFKRQLIALLNG